MSIRNDLDETPAESFDAEPPGVEQEVDRLYEVNAEFNVSLDAGGTIDDEGQFVVGSAGFLPSRVLATMDPEGYKEALAEWQDEQVWIREEAEQQALLGRADDLLDRHSNRSRFTRVVERVRAKQVVPFAGAGLSKPCGNELWGEFLVRLAEIAGQEKAVVEQRIRDGDYEGVAHDLIHAWMNPTWFKEQLRDAFELNTELRGSVLIVPKLFEQAVITTNFDLILEKAYTETGVPFEMTVVGGHAEPFVQAVNEGKHYLLKVHGDVRLVEDRILDKGEYDAAYGAPAIDLTLALPRALSRAFSSRSFLFLGCSLNTDRTMAVWESTIGEQDDYSLSHYAILEEPSDPGDRTTRENALTALHIFPIWYPPGDHGATEALLALLLDTV